MTEGEMSIVDPVTLVYKNKKRTKLLVQGDKVRGLMWVSTICARWFLQVLLFWHKINVVPKYFLPDICAEILTSRFLYLAAKIIYLSPLFSLAASLCTSAQPFSWLTVLASTQCLTAFSRMLLLSSIVLPFLTSFYSFLFFFILFFFFLRSEAIIIYLWIFSR